MAKAPRRRGRSGGSGRSAGGPRQARPAKPPAAQPVKPPAAKPVRPPAAKPVRPPAAKPVQPPAAKPVRPPAAAPARPAAQPAAAARSSARSGGSKSSGARRKRMAEEEVGGRRSQRAPRGGGGGGLGLGAKVLLATALPAFIVMVGMAFVGSGGEEEGPSALNEMGYRLVGTLSAIERAAWFGGGNRVEGYDAFKKDIKDLYGGEGTALIDKMEEYYSKDPAKLDDYERDEYLKEKQKFDATKQKLGKSAAADLPKTIQGRLARVATVDAVVPDSRYQIMAVWAREGTRNKPGPVMAASSGNYKSVPLDGGAWTTSGQAAHMDTTITQGGASYQVRVFAGSLGGLSSSKGTVFAAIYDAKQGAGGGGFNPMAIVFALVGAGIVAALGAMVAGGHAKGVKSLAREIDRLGTSGDPTRQIRAQGAEASQLARSVERMVGNLEFRQQHDGSDLEEIVSREQKIAAEIHQGLMSKNPPRLGGWEVETLFKPGFEIGGDHFEYFAIDEDHLGVILLDTNVRGIHAAVLMAAAKAYVRAAAPNTLSPAAVLKEVNRNLAGELPPGRHVTALYAVIDTTEGRATLASAGHLPLIVYRHGGGKVFKVNPEGIAMGLDKGPVFDSSLEEGDIEIGVGDRIVLYTDGGLMIQNEDGEEFGEARFYQAIAREAPKNSQAFVNFVGSSIDQFQLDAQQNDDITISTVKRLK